MPDSSGEFRARLEALELHVRGLEDRLLALEAAAAGPPPPQSSALPPLGAASGSPEEVDGGGPAQGIVALGGRTILALAGAYLIRAMTDAGVLPPLAGVALGLAYALACYALADRAGARDDRMSASFHGLAGGLIAYPLLWETSTRLGLVAPAVALMAVVGAFAAGSAVAARHKLGFVAWVGTLSALGTLASLLVATGELLGVVLALLLVAALLEGLAFQGLWPQLRWPAALILDGAVLVLVWLASRPEGFPEGYLPVSPAAAVAAVLALPALYLASIAARTLRLDQAVGPFEVLQGATALALGFGGAARLVTDHGGTGYGIAVAAVVLGTLCYAVAFAFLERRLGPATNFYFYSSAGGLLTLLGSRAILGSGGRALLCCALALLGCWLGRGFDRMTLRYHGAVYLCTAGLAAGLLGSTSRALWGDPRAGLTLPSVFGFLAAATASACAAVLCGDRKAQGWRRFPHGLVAAWATWVVAGILVAALVQASAAEQPAVVGTLRTGVLAALAVVLAALARRFALAELFWLAHAILVLGGLKLVAEDIPAGRAATLFLSFVLYGTALIAAPRLLRSRAT